MVDASSNRPKDLLYNCADQMVILSKSEPSAVYADLVWSEKDPAIAMTATHWSSFLTQCPSATNHLLGNYTTEHCSCRLVATAYGPL